MQHTLKPYLINAFYTWCMDIGYTPLITVSKSSKNLLPSYLLTESNVIFNIHPKSVRNLIFGKDTIEFEAIFNQEPSKVVLYYTSIFSIESLEFEYGLDFDIQNEDINNGLSKKPKLILIKNEEHT
jgi:stringent starvation protein B